MRRFIKIAQTVLFIRNEVLDQSIGISRAETFSHCRQGCRIINLALDAICVITGEWKFVYLMMSGKIWPLVFDKESVLADLMVINTV